MFVALTPTDQRPYIGSSESNSGMSLIFVYICDRCRAPCSLLGWVQGGTLGSHCRWLEQLVQQGKLHYIYWGNWMGSHFCYLPF
jgi:hypothetical protein